MPAVDCRGIAREPSHHNTSTTTRGLFERRPRRGFGSRKRRLHRARRNEERPTGEPPSQRRCIASSAYTTRLRGGYRPRWGRGNPPPPPPHLCPARLPPPTVNPVP